MTPFGQRVAAIRKELGLSQTKLGEQTRLGQPRISRIEKGELAASVEVITKIASVFGREGGELVTGTDREGYFVGETVSPEAFAEQQKTQRGLGIMMLSETYKRIVALFEATHGPCMTVNIQGSEMLYLQLTDMCKKLAASVRDFESDIEERLYYPDRLETLEDDRVVWDVHGKNALEESRLHLVKLEFKYCRELSENFRTLHITTFNLVAIDENAKEMQAERERLEKEWGVSGVRF